MRDLVYSNKKKLKDDNNPEKISITESLTRRRLRWVKNAKDEFGFRNVWTNNGIVYCRVGKTLARVRTRVHFWGTRTHTSGTRTWTRTRACGTRTRTRTRKNC